MKVVLNHYCHSPVEGVPGDVVDVPAKVAAAWLHNGGAKPLRANKPKPAPPVESVAEGDPPVDDELTAEPVAGGPSPDDPDADLEQLASGDAPPEEPKPSRRRRR